MYFAFNYTMQRGKRIGVDPGLQMINYSTKWLERSEWGKELMKQQDKPNTVTFTPWTWLNYLPGTRHFL